CLWRRTPSPPAVHIEKTERIGDIRLTTRRWVTGVKGSPVLVIWEALIAIRAEVQIVVVSNLGARIRAVILAARQTKVSRLTHFITRVKLLLFVRYPFFRASCAQGIRCFRASEILCRCIHIIVSLCPSDSLNS
ncbi:hypothetical protein Tcan_00191, partial [Toxocara canis]